jgi:hypothetical protein
MTDGTGTVSSRPTPSSAATRLMIDTAAVQANAMSVPVTVVVVDESG